MGRLSKITLTHIYQHAFWVNSKTFWKLWELEAAMAENQVTCFETSIAFLTPVPWQYLTPWDERKRISAFAWPWKWVKMAFSPYFHVFPSLALQSPVWIHISGWMLHEASIAMCNTMAITEMIMVLLLGWNLRNPRARAENTWFLLVCWFYWPWQGNTVLGGVGDYPLSLNFHPNPITALTTGWAASSINLC